MRAQDIKDFRERLGWTQEEMAKELGVSTATVSSWEQGRRNMPRPTERLLLKILQDRRLI